MVPAPKEKKPISAKSELTSEIGPASCPSNAEQHKSQHHHTTIKPNKEAIPLVECVAKNVIVMRAGQRVDDVFPDWIERCSQFGSYKPYDLNMPSSLPVERAIASYANDPPLTRLGLVVAQLTGRGLFYSNISPDVIYVSPALHCIQTAIELRRGGKNRAIIRVEPGLFENTSLYSQSQPTFVNARERQLLSFAIDNNYSPAYLSSEVFSTRETAMDYNRRIGTVINRIVRKYEFLPQKKDLTYLIIGHASTVDLAAGQLLHGPTPRLSTEAELAEVHRHVPPCSSLHLQMASGKWEVEETMPVSYESMSTAFDWDFVMRSSATVKTHPSHNRTPTIA